MAEASNDTPIKPEELQAALRQYVPEQKFERERDMLSGRYRIMTGEPLPRFSSAMAKAFSVRDVKGSGPALYALVFDSNAIPRKKNIAALKGFSHPNLVALLDEGVAEIGIYSESRYVVVLEQPVGQSLAELLLPNQKNPIPEITIINHVLRPLTEILKAFMGMGISHNRICLANAYLNNGAVIIGECISEPSGFSQEFLFEPIDRLLTSPWGKPDYDIGADCYALGILALHLLLGYQPYANAKREDFIASMLAKGSYHTLVIPWDISEHFQDLFRALVNNLKRERCAPEYIDFWLSGKAFNLILPGVAQETARGFEFNGQVYLNRKMLAHALFQHWEEARAVLLDSKLQRWLETAIHKKEVAETVARISSSSMGDTARGERYNNELLARTIIALDPSGPIRFKTLSFMPEAIGGMLAQAYFVGGDAEMQDVLQAFECDLAGWWIEQQKPVGNEYAPLSARLLKMRGILRIRAPGFGIERCLYDFYPSLMCQSTLVKRFCVLTLHDMLIALDTVSVNQKAMETDFVDTHIAAFIASRLELIKEIRVHEVDAVAELSANPRLASLKMLARAQYTAGRQKVRGLTHWMALRLFLLPDYIHKRTVRHAMQRQLQEAAGSGMVEVVAAVLLNADTFSRDVSAFRKAQQVFAARRHQIGRLNNPAERKKHARMVGRGLAQTLAYGTCLFTVYFTLRSYYHF